jgi:hypothetical protein
MMKITVRFACVAAAASLVLAQPSRHFAQRVIEELKVSHPEITGLELAAKKPGKGCQTIAATEVKEIGEKCDQDERTARSTNRPFVEQEKDGFDVTVPIHDATGKVIATAGMDFKRDPTRTKATVEAEGLKIAAELERRFTSEQDLFRGSR